MIGHKNINIFALLVSLLLLTISSAITQSVNAQSSQLPDSLKGLTPQAIFDKANLQNEKKHYKSALGLYHAIEHTNTGSGALFLNMGLTYLNTDSLGKAKYYFLRASKYPETRKQAQQGLNYLSNHLSHKSAELPELPWDRALNWLQNDIGAHTLLIISLLILNAGILLIVGVWFIEKYKKTLRYSGIILTLLGILFLLTTGFVDYHTRRYSQGVMIMKEANVNEKPNKNAGVVSIAYEGYTFTVDKEKSARRDNWYYIRMSNGLYGWIPKKDIKVL